MDINTDHPSFISFLDTVTKNILSNISLNNYFKLTTEKKLGVQYAVYKLMKTGVKSRGVLKDNDFKSFITVLWKKNEDLENFEFASVLNDIKNNFDTINEILKPKKIPNKIKVEVK